MINPKKLCHGDEIRVIAPARSLSIINKDRIQIAIGKLQDLGFKITFSKHCQESDTFSSSSIASRVDDIHEAFRDISVAGILTVIGGFNSNQLLDSLDYELIKNNPKILCGYSDITALSTGITVKTGLVTYSGLHFSTWGMQQEFKYNEEYFKKCLMSEGEYQVFPSKTWSDDAWYRDQEIRDIRGNNGYILIQPGRAEGTIFGGNLCTLNLLQGTKYMPDISNSILFLEDDDATGNDFAVEFDRNLQSLLQQPGAESIRGLVIGRFQKNANITIEELRYIVKTKQILAHIPIIANADFGHTNPMMTFPIGGTARLEANKDILDLSIILH